MLNIQSTANPEEPRMNFNEWQDYIRAELMGGAKPYYMEQGSDEWRNIRVGKITGSSMKSFTDKDLNRLITEIITGQKDEIHKNSYMEHGTEMEPIARKAYENTTGQQVMEVGFIEHPIFPEVGFSPDGLIANPEGKIFKAVEFKCPKATTHVQYIRNGFILPPVYETQILSYFFCIPTLEIVDFVSFCPEVHAKPMHIIKCNREQFKFKLDSLHQKIIQFIAKVRIGVKEINQNNAF